MIRKKFRLGKEEIGRIFNARSGIETSSSAYCALKRMKNGLGYGRYAVIAPAAVFKTAVERHRVRRQGYNACLGLTEKGYDTIITLRAPFRTLPSGRAEEELKKQLNIFYK